MCSRSDCREALRGGGEPGASYVVGDDDGPRDVVADVGVVNQTVYAGGVQLGAYAGTHAG